ncbi:MAG: hypothetical protein EU547_06855 [Promethearchaeota archaeon]|nr:MAG: hypothetical protein EU547_06855 [Candidatus Lokiarchaeota archaeon]
MANSHNQSFFGQNVAMFVRSSSKFDDFIFVQSIKRKGGNVWEKPSQGEGKNIKISLGEMIMIQKVLNREQETWSTYHRYKEENTQISVNWQEKAIWINIGEYNKKLKSPNIEILSLLINHLIKEKIEFSTGRKPDDAFSSPSKASKKLHNLHNATPKPSLNKIQSNRNSEKIVTNLSSTPNTQNTRHQGWSEGDSKVIIKEEIINNPSNIFHKKGISNKNTSSEPIDTRNIKGIIQRETPKALLIRFESGIESWIPKSTIHSDFSSQITGLQSFLIQSWVLDKKNAAT